MNRKKSFQNWGGKIFSRKKIHKKVTFRGLFRTNKNHQELFDEAVIILFVIFFASLVASTFYITNLIAEMGIDHLPVSSVMKTYWKILIMHLFHTLLTFGACVYCMHKVRNSTKLDELTNICTLSEFHIRKVKYDSTERLIVFCIDLNNLKSVNDTWGHAYGDQAIKNVGEVLKTLRYDYYPVDYFRVGGDEFLVVLDGTSYSEITESIANDIMQDVKARISKYHVCEQQLTAAVGCCFRNSFYEHGSVEDMIKIADGRMYDDKMNMKGEIKQN